MRGRKRRGLAVDENVVISPEVSGAHIAAEIEFVERAVDTVRTALGHHLYLASGGVVELRRLVAGSNLEFLDALNWRRNDAGRSTTRGAPAAITVAWSVGRVTTGHIVAVVATVQLESILIDLSSGDIARQ